MNVEPYVILFANGSREIPLYARKAVLARESPYFRDLFASEGGEDRMEEFNIPVDFQVLHLMLQITHGPFTFPRPDEQFYLVLERMYEAAVLLGLDSLRQFCIDYLHSVAITGVHDEESAEATSVAVRLGFYDIFVEYDDQDPEDHQFCELFYFMSASLRPCLSKEGVREIYDARWARSHNRAFPIFPTEPRLTLRLEDIVRNDMIVRRDFTRPLVSDDVGLITWNSRGRILYVSKDALSRGSNYFSRLFFSLRALRCGQIQPRFDFVSVPVEFATMRQILWALHTPDELLLRCRIHPVLLYDMYYSCGPQELDIPWIHSFFCRMLLCESRQYKTLAALDVATKMGLSESQIIAVENKAARTEDALHEWFIGQKLLYVRNGRLVDITSNSTDKILSLHAIFCVYPLC